MGRFRVGVNFFLTLRRGIDATLKRPGENPDILAR